jgi:hypothetical protein
MFASRVLRCAAVATVKKTTGIVGLPPVAGARGVLTELYNETLEELKVSRCALTRLPRAFVG